MTGRSNFKYIYLFTSIIYLLMAILILWDSTPDLICQHFTFTLNCDNMMPKKFIFFEILFIILMIALLEIPIRNHKYIDIPNKTPKNINLVVRMTEYSQYFMIFLGYFLLMLTYYDSNIDFIFVFIVLFSLLFFPLLAKSIFTLSK